ncbi:hypothetical protein L083_6682 [Actinoplanes sp. N902-109]|nr:hypothetical protein L083_6682 [Actinoplanes sp. N902-109]
MALIELSTGPPAQPVAAGPPPAWVYRRAGLLVSVLLLLALGGAAPPSSVLWQHVSRIEIGTSDLQGVVLGGGRLFGVEANTPHLPVSAWSVTTGRKLWSVPDLFVDDRLTALPSGLLVLTSDRGMTVLDAATGAQRWAAWEPGRILDPRTALLIGEQFRPGTGYDPNSGAPGRLYGSGFGGLHTEPAQRTTLSVVDLPTGRVRWSATTPGSIATASTGTGVVMFTADRIILRSAATGEVLHERTLDADHRNSVGGEVHGDVVLTHQGDYGRAGRITAYDARTLDRLWEQAEPDPQGNPVRCLGVPCLVSRTDVTVLDPATGAALWRSDTSSDLISFGDSALLEVDALDPKALVDRRTGRTLLTLDRWTSYARLPDGTGLLLLASEGRNQVVGLLPAGATKIQPLGRAPAVVVPCLPDTSYAACRVFTAYEVYRYREE